MNEGHAELCSSPEWSDYLRSELLPAVLDRVELGEELLEVGAGYGLATDVLRERAARVTAVEIDPALAAALVDRFTGTNVTVVEADATELPFGSSTFHGAASFTMLHHVPTPALQDRLLAEIARVLRPRGAFVGSDSLDDEEFRAFHEGDVCVPVDPSGLVDRLRRAGFGTAEVTVTDDAFLFVARSARS